MNILKIRGIFILKLEINPKKARDVKTLYLTLLATYFFTTA
jgi:hypothetical protein